jgi:hypothetical protein
MAFSQDDKRKLSELHATLVCSDVEEVDEVLKRAARAVVDARYEVGDDAWDKLKNAILP